MEVKPMNRGKSGSIAERVGKIVFKASSEADAIVLAELAGDLMHGKGPIKDRIRLLLTVSATKAAIAKDHITQTGTMKKARKPVRNL